MRITNHPRDSHAGVARVVHNVEGPYRVGKQDRRVQVKMEPRRGVWYSAIPRACAQRVRVCAVQRHVGTAQRAPCGSGAVCPHVTRACGARGAARADPGAGKRASAPRALSIAYTQTSPAPPRYPVRSACHRSLASAQCLRWQPRRTETLRHQKMFIHVLRRARRDAARVEHTPPECRPPRPRKCGDALRQATTACQRHRRAALDRAAKPYAQTRVLSWRALSPRPSPRLSIVARPAPRPVQKYT